MRFDVLNLLIEAKEKIIRGEAIRVFKKWKLIVNVAMALNYLD